MIGETNVFANTNGPRDAEVILVGEAWGEEEARKQQPFVGYSGQELDRMLSDAGLHRSKILCTNLVSARPLGNDFTRFLNPGTKKADANFRGVFAQDILINGHARLLDLIQQVKPKLIIGCGNWPLWALTSHARLATSKGYRLPSGIMDWRGSQTFTEPIDGNQYPYLPIIHPAAITRDWSLRHITCHDLRYRSASRLKRGGDRDQFRSSWTGPARHTQSAGTFEQADGQLREWLSRLNAGDPIELCCDVETWRRRYLAVVGLCDGATAIAIPFFYFDENGLMIDTFTLEQEQHIAALLREVLSHPLTSVVNQNYAYDYTFLSTYLGIFKKASFDTMLGHHLLYPGTPKSLDYLASLYCRDYCFWKHESQDWDTRSDHLAMWNYNCKDTWYTWEITQILRHLIKHAGLQEHYALQARQRELYHNVSDYGIRWDNERAIKMREDLIHLAQELGDWLSACMPDEIAVSPSGKPWYASNSHSQWIIYDNLKIDPVKHKKTKKPTLDKESFETLSRRAPWLSPIFEQLKLLRSVNVFEKNFLNVGLGMDRRLHSAFNVGGTETFRLSSSSNPFEEGMNLQNLPKKEED